MQRVRHLICSARVPRMRARSYLVMYRVVMRGPSLGCAGPVITCALHSYRPHSLKAAGPMLVRHCVEVPTLGS